MLALLLSWKRCPDGAEIFDHGPYRKGKTIAGAPPWGPHFRLRSSRREPLILEVSDLKQPFILRFINANDDAKRLEFLSRFGPLTAIQEEIPRESVIEWQRGLRALLQKVGTASPMTAINAVNKAISSHKTFAAFPVLKMVGAERHPRLTLELQNLIGLMLMETAVAAVAGARTTACHHCNDVILTGPMTDRRSTAQYCSDRCRVAAAAARAN